MEESYLLTIDNDCLTLIIHEVEPDTDPCSFMLEEMCILKSRRNRMQYLRNWWAYMPPRHLLVLMTVSKSLAGRLYRYWQPIYEKTAAHRGVYIDAFYLREHERPQYQWYYNAVLNRRYLFKDDTYIGGLLIYKSLHGVYGAGVQSILYPALTPISSRGTVLPGSCVLLIGDYRRWRRQEKHVFRAAIRRVLDKWATTDACRRLLVGPLRKPAPTK